MLQWKIEFHYKGGGVISGIFTADSMDSAILKGINYFNVRDYLWISAQVVGGV